MSHMRHILAVLLTAAALVLGAAPAHAATPTRIAGFTKAGQAVKPGTALKYSVKVTTKGRASKARVVTLQRRVNGTWVKVDRARTNRYGRVVLRYRAPAKAGAAIALRVRVSAKGSLKAANSPAKRVAARAPWKPDARSQEILRLVNEARASERTCGQKTYEAQAPVSLNQRLTAAAKGHAKDMAVHDYFSHTGRDGATVADRVDRQGYDWRSVGENIAAGYDSPAEVMRGWLRSPGHCANLMSDAFTHLGVGYATDSSSRYGTYWVQNFGAPR